MATADDSSAAPRRVRVERNIYRRASGVYEVGFKDGAGRQRWRTVDGGITAARAARDELLVRRSRGERVASNARLRFGDAAAQWLDGPVVDLRATTQACYRNAVEQHLMRRFATHRLDTISPDDLAALVRELRADGLAESTIVIVVGVVNRIYRYAARRLGWAGTNPVSLLLPSERPKPGQSAKRPLFERGELEQTIAAAGEPYRTLFTLAALTGARVSELSALRWADVRISDPEDAEVEFASQVDRHGNLGPTKTDGSVTAACPSFRLALRDWLDCARTTESIPTFVVRSPAGCSTTRSTTARSGVSECSPRTSACDRQVHVVLADPKHEFGFQNVAPVVKQSVLTTRNRPSAQTLNAVDAKLTTKAIIAMNAAVALDKQSPTSVAHAFLNANGLL